MGTPASATEPERRMIHCTACNELVKWNSWAYHRRTKQPESVVDEKNKEGHDDDVGHIDDTDESKHEVKDRGKRPVKPDKRRLSEPKPICTIIF